MIVPSYPTIPKIVKLTRKQEEKDRVLILNYIHKRLRDVNDRFVPFLNDKKIELYHRDTFEDVDVDICVYWPGHFPAIGCSLALKIDELQKSIAL